MKYDLLKDGGEHLGLDKCDFDYFIDQIDGDNRIAVDSFMSDGNHRQLIDNAPGSRSAHHNWIGGYREHLRQAMTFVANDFYEIVECGRMAELPEAEQYTLSDALTVMFLHDIEKMFKYGDSEKYHELMESDPELSAAREKDQNKIFRQRIIERYGFQLTPTTENALLHVEGVRDEYYVPGRRADQPLAASCHAADTKSARIYYDHCKKF